MDENEVVEYAKVLLVAEKHVCESCGHKATEFFELDENPVQFGPDPYVSEIGGDDTPLWQCEKCSRESAWDI